MNINNQSETLDKLKNLMMNTEFNDIETVIDGKKVACHKAQSQSHKKLLKMNILNSLFTLDKGECWCSTFVGGY